MGRTASIPKSLSSAMGTTSGQQPLLDSNSKEIENGDSNYEESEKRDELAFKAVACTFTTYTFVDLYLMIIAFHHAHQGIVEVPMASVGFHVAMWAFLGCLFAVDAALQGRLAWMARDYLVQDNEDIKQIASYSFNMHMFSIIVMFVYQGYVVFMSYHDWKMAMVLLFVCTLIRASKLRPLWKLRLSMEAASKDGTYEVMYLHFIPKQDPQSEARRNDLKRKLLILLALLVGGKIMLIALRPFGITPSGLLGDAGANWTTTNYRLGDQGANLTVTNLVAPISNISGQAPSGPVVTPWHPLWSNALTLSECTDATFGGAGAGCLTGGAATEWTGPPGALLGCAAGGLVGWFAGC